MCVKGFDNTTASLKGEKGEEKAFFLPYGKVSHLILSQIGGFPVEFFTVLLIFSKFRVPMHRNF